MIKIIEVNINVNISLTIKQGHFCYFRITTIIILFMHSKS